MSLVLPPVGHYVVFTTEDKQNRWAQTLDEVAQVIQALGSRSDIYFAVASFKQPGSKFAGRTQDNVAALKCLRLDLDAGPEKVAKHGPEKVYNTWQDALEAVNALESRGLCPSVVVHSGAGLHVYYVLSSELEPGEWRSLALALQRFAVNNGVKADPAVTADHARVLRPIGTRHPNGNVVKAIKVTGATYDPEELAKLLAPAAPKYDTSVNDDIKPTVIGPPKSLQKIIRSCKAMEHVYLHQETVQEPLWRLGIGIAKYTVHGFKGAVVLSNRHPNYDEAELRDKFDRWTTGPARCERFAEHLPDTCAQCPHNGKVTSPILLGAMTPEEEQKFTSTTGRPTRKQDDQDAPWTGMIPQGFSVHYVNGSPMLFCKMPKPIKKEDGTVEVVDVDVPFASDVFWFLHWADAAHTNDNAVVTMRKATRNGVVDFVFDQSVLASRSKLLEHLAGKAIHTTSHKYAGQAMENYVKAQLERIKSMAQRVKIGDRLGVRILPNGELVAVQGKYLVRGDGVIEEIIPSSKLAAECSSYSIPIPRNELGRWDKSAWKQHILPAAARHVAFMREYYAIEGYEKYQLAIMCALASPLMAFVADGYWAGTELPGNGLSVSLFSEHGGKGKTTVMRCAQLAFGTPASLNRDNDDLNTTMIARMARLSSAGTMPVSMDEMGDIDPKMLAQLIRTVANGSGRARADKTGALQAGSSWALICLIGTNRSQRELINSVRQTSSAEQFRLLELDVEKLPEFGLERQTAFEREWKLMGSCAGALGAVIHLAICRMGVEAVNKFVAERVAQAAKMVQAIHVESASRFQYRALGAVLALFDILEKVNLCPFSREPVINAFLEAYGKTVEFVNENITSVNGVELLGRMLQDFQSKTIITKSLTNLRNRSEEKRAVSYDMDIRGRAPTDAVARHIISSRLTYVSAAAMREWCDAHGVRQAFMIRDARERGVLERPFPSAEDKYHKWTGPFNLYSGMQENPGGSVSCYVVNVKKLAQLLDDPSVMADKAPVMVVDFEEAKKERAA